MFGQICLDDVQTEMGQMGQPRGFTTNCVSDLRRYDFPDDGFEFVFSLQ